MSKIKIALCLILVVALFAFSKFVPFANISASTTSNADKEHPSWQGQINFGFTLSLFSRNQQPPSETAPTEGTEKTNKLMASNAQSINGVDLSKWQGNVNFEEVKQAGNAYVFLKATQGTQEFDPDYQKNIHAARAAGLVIGSYHYYMPSESPESQFEYFSSHLNIKNGDLPPVVDIEILNGSRQKSLAENLKLFLSLVEKKYNAKPIIYSGKYFANQYLSGFENYPLWLAEYNTDREPILPLDWKSWTFWQHTSGGIVRGVNGPVDLNVFNGSEAKFKAILISLQQ